jgi:hypothetical protein
MRHPRTSIARALSSRYRLSQTEWADGVTAAEFFISPTSLTATKGKR